MLRTPGEHTIPVASHTKIDVYRQMCPHHICMCHNAMGISVLYILVCWGWSLYGLIMRPTVKILSVYACRGPLLSPGLRTTYICMPGPAASVKELGHPW